MFELVDGDRWRSGPVTSADRFLQRWRGLRPAHGGRALLLAGRSVHGWGMRDTLTVVFLDAGLRVVTVRTLRPGGVVAVRRARWMLELPPDRGRPEVGATLSRVAGWRES